MDTLINGLQAKHFPPITREEHEAAKARIAAEREKFITLVFPDGKEIKWQTGEVSHFDLIRANGYGVFIGDYDNYGWPKGHPESPATSE